MTSKGLSAGTGAAALLIALLAVAANLGRP